MAELASVSCGSLTAEQREAVIRLQGWRARSGICAALSAAGTPRARDVTHSRLQGYCSGEEAGLFMLHCPAG